jgi:hypothetical protein
MDLSEYEANIHSQCGEDGILAEILKRLPVTDAWCVEFGAWDGKHLSNTSALIESKGYSAVLIEGDKGRYEDLKKRYRSRPNVVGINRFVGFTESDGLNAILAETAIPSDFDLLSIDIDGNDYHVWRAVSLYKPKIVCIEFNPTIPTEVDFVQAADSKVNQGASLLALTRLGKQKDYELVAVTSWNAIFVRKEYFSLFGIADNSPIALRKHLEWVPYVFSGFDGTIISTGAEVMAWHGIRYDTRIKQLPRIFRAYPGNFGPATAKLFALYCKVLSWLKRA